MARRINVEALELRAMDALSALRWSGSGLPRQQQRPEWYVQALRDGVGASAGLANDPAYLRARTATDAWAAAVDLRERATTILADPEILAFAGHNGQNLQWYAEHPERALSDLVEAKVMMPRLFRDGMPLERAMMVAAEAMEFHTDYPAALDMPELPEAGYPPFKGSPADEYEALISKPSRTEAEHQRLISLAEGRIAEQGQKAAQQQQKAEAEAKASAPPNLYEKLIEQPTRSQEEHDLLLELAAERYPDEHDVEQE